VPPVPSHETQLSGLPKHVEQGDLHFTQMLSTETYPAGQSPIHWFKNRFGTFPFLKHDVQDDSEPLHPSQGYLHILHEVFVELYIPRLQLLRQV